MMRLEMKVMFDSKMAMFERVGMYKMKDGRDLIEYGTDGQNVENTLVRYWTLKPKLKTNVD